MTIRRNTFSSCRELEVVELCDGLLEIGESAFQNCKSLKQITIPSTVVRIGAYALQIVPVSIQLPDSIESIGHRAFVSNDISNFRIPPRISTIREGTFICCRYMFSLELPETVTDIEERPFSNSLRNIALPSAAEISVQGDPFLYSDDLKQLFLSDTNIINALKHRFDNLPIHKMVYYQSYNNVTSDELNNATAIDINRRNSQWQTGRQQDCLGMTPLHILACSTVQNVELYRVLVNKYPANLVTVDRWGALPLLYAVWGRAPSEIIQFLVDSYKSTYPNYEFDWDDMMTTLGLARAPPTVIQNLLDLQQQSFPEETIQLDRVLYSLGDRGSCPTTFGFLVKCSIKKRVNAIGLKQYRDAIMEKVDSFTRRRTPISEKKRWEFLTEVQTMLTQYETKYQNLKEATSVLELVLWKKSINETMSDDERGTRKRKFGETDLREQSRVNCGADIIIGNVLPYLVTIAK